MNYESELREKLLDMGFRVYELKDFNVKSLEKLKRQIEENEEVKLEIRRNEDGI